MAATLTARRHLAPHRANLHRRVHSIDLPHQAFPRQVLSIDLQVQGCPHRVLLSLKAQAATIVRIRLHREAVHRVGLETRRLQLTASSAVEVDTTAASMLIRVRLRTLVEVEQPLPTRSSVAIHERIAAVRRQRTTSDSKQVHKGIMPRMKETRTTASMAKALRRPRVRLRRPATLGISRRQA